MPLSCHRRPDSGSRTHAGRASRPARREYPCGFERLRGYRRGSAGAVCHAEGRGGRSTRLCVTSGTAPGQRRLANPAPFARTGLAQQAVFARLRRSEWPREESSLRAWIRSPPLYPLSYGAARVAGYRGPKRSPRSRGERRPGVIGSAASPFDPRFRLPLARARRRQHRPGARSSAPASSAATLSRSPWRTESTMTGTRVRPRKPVIIHSDRSREAEIEHHQIRVAARGQCHRHLARAARSISWPPAFRFVPSASSSWARRRRPGSRTTPPPSAGRPSSARPRRVLGLEHPDQERCPTASPAGHSF